MTKPLADHLLTLIATGRHVLWDLEAAGAARQEIETARQWLDELEQVVLEGRQQTAAFERQQAMART
jgi:hypothetical protein